MAAAIAEFGRVGFSRGSLNVIAREAGVAKGSLFQYFTDKLDLFATVGEEVALRIRAGLEPILAEFDPDQPFFGFVTEALDAWVTYFAEHPAERAVTVATNLEMDSSVRDAVRAVSYRQYLEVLPPLVEAARDKGELRPDVDTDVMVAFLLLILPHLAIAPYVSGMDPVLGMYGQSVTELKTTVRRFVAMMEVLFAAPAGNCSFD